MRYLVLTLALSLVACSNSGKIESDDTGETAGTDGGADDGGSSTDEGGTDEGGTDDTGATDDTGTAGGDDTGTADDCEAEVDSTWPEDGDDAFYYRDEISFYLSEPDASATITVDGISGTSSLDDTATVVTFTPDGDLDGASSYTATLSYCAGAETISFSTSDLGGEVDVDSLPGLTYALNLGTGTVVNPPGLEDLLGLFGADLEQTLFLQVTESSDTTINFISALPDDTGDQDYCNATLDFPTADFTEAPYFQIGPKDIIADIGDTQVPIERVYVSGTFASDGTYIGGMELSGTLDLDVIGPALGVDGETICNYGSFVGIYCEECGDGDETCLSLEIVDMDAEGEETSLDRIEMDDCHVDCPASAKNPDCTL